MAIAHTRCPNRRGGQASARSPRRLRRYRALIAGIVGSCLAISGCGAAHTGSDGTIRVVTTTSLLADLVHQVAGDRVQVTALVPPGADPHSYEVRLRAVRDVAYADLALSNYLLLEEHSIIRTLDANLRPGVQHIPLAETATKYGATAIPLVEHANLDTVWLGLRVLGNGAKYGAVRSSRVHLRATAIEGPGRFAAYLTETFGRPKIIFANSDGVDGKDTVELPLDAHTHMSWGFTEPGIYKLGLEAKLEVSDGAPQQVLATGEATFAVGIDPHAVASAKKAHVVSEGHADITVNLDCAGSNCLTFRSDNSKSTEVKEFPLESVVIDVPPKALSIVPADPAFGFLSRPASPAYLLPQAVLGKHVHGEIDPHMWHDVRNTKAYVRVIRDELTRIDPGGRRIYSKNADQYLAQLDQLDTEVADIIKSIPEQNRYLVTTHDAFGYLAKAYGMKIAGFVTPSPSSEPSLAERTRLVNTLRTLHVKAVFLEPALAARANVLRQVADDVGIQVCPILGDTFTNGVDNYHDMMLYNANSLARCLGGSPSA